MQHSKFNQSFVYFMHMPNACFNCDASLKSLACLLKEELQRQEQHHVIFYATYCAKMSKLLILQAQNKNCSNDIFFFNFYHSKKIGLDFSSEDSL